MGNKNESNDKGVKEKYENLKRSYKVSIVFIYFKLLVFSLSI
jgi:Zn-dependent peptidase ImmA (M78 family)